MHQWLPTGNISHNLLPTRSRSLLLYCLFVLGEIFCLSFSFFGKCVGDVDVNVDMLFSQWLSVAYSTDANGRPEVTTETSSLTAIISVWKFDELICGSHIVPLISVTRMRTSCSFCMCYGMLHCLSWGESCVPFVALSEFSMHDHLFLVSHFTISHQDKTTVHAWSIKKFATNSNSLKKGNENTTHNSLWVVTSVTNCKWWKLPSRGLEGQLTFGQAEVSAVPGSLFPSLHHWLPFVAMSHSDPLQLQTWNTDIFCVMWIQRTTVEETNTSDLHTYSNRSSSLLGIWLVACLMARRSSSKKK